RAAETAALALPDARPETRDDLVEWDYGEYEGLTTDQIREKRPGWNLWRDGVPGGESGDEVGARADRTIAEARRSDGDVALFGHGHALRVLAARWIGSPWRSGASLALQTATLSVLGYERETPVIVHWNTRCTQNAS